MKLLLYLLLAASALSAQQQSQYLPFGKELVSDGFRFMMLPHDPAVISALVPPQYAVAGKPEIHVWFTGPEGAGDFFIVTILYLDGPLPRVKMVVVPSPPSTNRWFIASIETDSKRVLFVNIQAVRTTTGAVFEVANQ